MSSSTVKRKEPDDCSRLEGSIAPYLDGELDADHAVDLEAHVIACGTCAERVALLRSMRKSLKRTSARRCSDALRSRLTATVIQERQSAEAAAAPPADEGIGPKLIRLRYAVGLAAAAGVVFAMGMSRHAHQPRDPFALLTPKQSDVATTMTGFDILDDLISLHANPLPPETTNPEELQRWDPLVGVPVRRPPFQPFGASFSGARVHSMSDRRAALLQYTLRGGHRVTVYVFNPRVVQVNTMRLEERTVHERSVFVGSLRGYSIAAAEQSGVGYALASDLGTDQSTNMVLAAVQQ
jgi:anti-sigma factor RsiW